MKNKWYRSIGCKIVAFLACGLTGTLLALTAAGILALCLEGYYNKTESEIYARYSYLSVEEAVEEFGNGNILQDMDIAFSNADALEFKIVHTAYSFKFIIFAVFASLLLISLLLYIYLMCITARRPDSEDVIVHSINVVPIEIELGIFAVACCIGAGLVIDMWEEMEYGHFEAVVFLCFSVLICTIIVNAFIGVSMAAAAQIKQHTLVKRSLIGMAVMLIIRLAKWLWKIMKKLGNFIVRAAKNISFLWIVVLIYIVVLIFDLILIESSATANDEMIFFSLFVKETVVFAVALVIALSVKKITDSTNRLAAGELGYHTDEQGLYGTFKKQGENLNKIAAASAVAVEDKLKSERMKTELITNVSHDIKTPLTSIINYASLIGNGNCTQEQTDEYAAVLVRQSERLKRLIEDLVEASKAATGCLEVTPVPCDAGIFIEQAVGEYEEKLAASQLTLVCTKCEEPVMIMADSRRMWRIFDNLMNNICKYAQSGTRVYLELQKSGNEAMIAFKNISKEPLNVSVEELMERFVRGDSSRHTEGNGLGLSIAQSLAQLQGGRLGIYVDGDLFKAMLVFPIITEE